MGSEWTRAGWNALLEWAGTNSERTRNGLARVGQCSERSETESERTETGWYGGRAGWNGARGVKTVRNGPKQVRDRLGCSELTQTGWNVVAERAETTSERAGSDGRAATCGTVSQRVGPGREGSQNGLDWTGTISERIGNLDILGTGLQTSGTVSKRARNGFRTGWNGIATDPNRLGSVLGRDRTGF